MHAPIHTIILCVRIDEKLNEIASENFPGKITQNIVYFKGICKNCLKNH